MSGGAKRGRRHEERGGARGVVGFGSAVCRVGSGMDLERIAVMRCRGGSKKGLRIFAGLALWAVFAAVLGLVSPGAAQDRDPEADLDDLEVSGNGSASGIWSDGVTMWVADYVDGKVYAYRLSDGERQASLEFDLSSENPNPQATRALGLEVSQQSAGFEDVDPDSAHGSAIDALYAAGITVGCSSDPLGYCPDRAVTRAEMATFLTRALGLEVSQQSAGFKTSTPTARTAPLSTLCTRLGSPLAVLRFRCGTARSGR